MPSDCCYFVVKAAAADAAPALNNFSSILHRSAVFTQNLGQTLAFGFALDDIEEMAPVKSSERALPITDLTLQYFVQQKERQERQRQLLATAGEPYYDNDLVIAKPNGCPLRRERVSSNFGQFLRHHALLHIRFHNLRHSAATNMHELTGDFYTVGQILGHSLKGIGIQLGISNNMESVTAQYVDVRLGRKSIVLDTYHKATLHHEE